jgi:hypothetical protein
MHTAHEATKEAAFIRSHGRAVLIATGIDARANLDRVVSIRVSITLRHSGE